MHKTEIIQLLTKKSLIVGLTLSAAAFAFAQEKVAITGNVVDDKNQAIPYASVSFSNQQSKLYSDATLTDEKGKYSLSLVPGNYEITVEAIDYQKKSLTKAISSNGNLGAITIEAEKSSTLVKTGDIKGVVITATTKPYKVEIDKKTYDPSQDIVSKGGNLQDVLANVPSVSVDTDGTVSMRGSTNVRFLINGKPSALLGIDDGANALQSIPADQIERIEVITNPSSKFEASGTAGILNIILKKSKKTGFNGSVQGTLGYLPNTSLNTNLSWRKGGLTWFLNGGGGYRESRRTNRTDNFYQNVSEIGGTVESKQENLADSFTNSYNASTGLVYDFSDRTSFNVSGTVRTYDGENKGTVTYDNILFQKDNTSRFRTTDGTSNNLAFQGDLGLDHKFDDNGQNIALSVSLQSNTSKNNTDINETLNGKFDLKDLIKQDTQNKTIIGKADYELPLGEISKIEAGYRLDFNQNNYDNTVEESTAANTTLAILPLYTYDALYQEMFNAAYVQYKSKIGKLGYQIGLRNELSNIKLNYSNQDNSDPDISNNKTYNNLFPSVFLSYELSKDNQFLLNYSKRIDRPRSFFLIPNPSYTDNQNIFDGNIDLNPSYVDSFELGYSISKKKFTLNPTLYFRYQNDDTKMLVYNKKETFINNKNEPEDRIVFHTKPINLGSDERIGMDFNFSWDATSWLKFMGNVDVYQYKTKGSTLYETLDKELNPIIATADFSGKGVASTSRLSASFKIDKTFNFQLQGFYRGGTKTAFQDRKDIYALSIGASKTILKGDGTLTLNIQDVFNTRAMRVTTFGNNFTRESYMQWQPRQFAVSFTYRFKQGEKVEQPKKKKDINANANGGGEEQGPM